VLRDIQLRRRESVVHDEKLRHRLGRPTRFGRHHEQCAREPQPAQKRCDRLRIDVVENLKAWIAAASFVVEHVPAAWPQRGAQSDGAKRRPADAEDYDIVVFTACSRREFRHLLQQRPVYRQIEEPDRASRP
jgi:hypothetical protein